MESPATGTADKSPEVITHPVEEHEKTIRSVRLGLRGLARSLTRAGHEAEAKIALKAEELLKDA